MIARRTAQRHGRITIFPSTSPDIITLKPVWMSDNGRTRSITGRTSVTSSIRRRSTRGEISAGADRTLFRDRRQQILFEQREDQADRSRADARVTPSGAVRANQHGGPNHLVGRDGAGADGRQRETIRPSSSIVGSLAGAIMLSPRRVWNLMIRGRTADVPMLARDTGEGHPRAVPALGQDVPATSSAYLRFMCSSAAPAALVASSRRARMRPRASWDAWAWVVPGPWKCGAT
jgi:hypothetical protein